MELKEYIHIFGKAKAFIIGGTLLILIVTLLFTVFRTTNYDTSISITVDRVNTLDQKDASYYLYDDYYSIQASGFFADTVLNWMQSPAVVRDIYANAGVPLPSLRTVAQMGKLFTVRKHDPATISISMRSEDSSKAQSLLTASNTELKRLTDEINTARQNEQFVLRATDPVSAEVKPFWALNITIAILLGFLITTFLTLLNSYIKETHRS